MAITKLDAAVLFAVATDAAERITVSDRIGGQPYALISIVFSVVALEAFLNEAIELAEQVSYDDEAVATFADLMNDQSAYRWKQSWGWLVGFCPGSE